MVSVKTGKPERNKPITISGKAVTIVYNGKESKVTNNLLKKIMLTIHKKIKSKKKEKSKKDINRLCKKTTISLKI